MNRTMCPGQDTRYWRPGDIFNVTCGSCGTSVEFFKDDASRRCPGCGIRVRNPRLTMGCAAWCRHARECLGYEPKGKKYGSEGTAHSIADAIIDSIRRELGERGAVLERSLAAYERACALLNGGDANPRVVIPAVLLLRVDDDPSRAAGTAVFSLPVARKILDEAGSDRYSAEEVCGLILAYRQRTSVNSPEYRAVAESYANI